MLGWLGALLFARALPPSLFLCMRSYTAPLRSSVHDNLLVPFARSATMQTRSFSVVGPTTWNGLPIDLRHLWSSKRCLFSIPPPSQDCSFPLGLGRERL